MTVMQEAQKQQGDLSSWMRPKEGGDMRFVQCQHITLHPPIISLPVFLTGRSSEGITVITIGRICVGEVLRAKKAQQLTCCLSRLHRVALSEQR